MRESGSDTSRAYNERELSIRVCGRARIYTFARYFTRVE